MVRYYFYDVFSILVKYFFKVSFKAGVGGGGGKHE